MNKAEESGRYQNGKIYKLWNPAIEDFYIGSTCTSLPKRWHKHKCNAFTRNSDSPVYQKMREVGLEGWRIELIEDYKCNSKNELLRREGEKIRELKPSLNIVVAGRDKAEYYQDNAEQIKAKVKQYRADNIEVVREREKNYRNQNSEQRKAYCKQYYRNNTEKRKEQAIKYREENAEAIRERKKKYYNENKEKTHRQVNCECGGHYLIRAKARHFKTELHKKYMNQSNPEE